MSTIASPTPLRHPALEKRLGAELSLEEGTASAFSSAYLHDSSLSDNESELSNFDFASDDDEAGVFFGAHNPIERKIVASLSRSIPSSPASCSLATLAEGPRRSSLANTTRAAGGARKAESREFLRRKTLMHGELDGSFNISAEKGDGSFLQTAEEDGMREQPEAGPSSRPFGDTSLALDHGELADTSEEDMPSFHIEDGMFPGDPMSDDGDKENTMLPEPYYDFEAEEEYAAPLERVDDKPITIGFSGGGLDDVSTEIDMGGLTILDLDDPDLGPLEDTSIAFDSLGEITGDVDSSRSTVPNDLDDSFLGRSTCSGQSIVLENPFVTFNHITSLPIPDVPRPADSSESSPHPRPLTTPVKQVLARELFPQTPSEAIANTSYDSDLDSPIVARGPIVIPVFSIVSPHASATPLRGLQPGPSRIDLPPPDMAPNMAMNLPSLDSPTQRMLPSITPRRVAPSLARLPKTPASVLKNRTPPSRMNVPHVPVSQRPNRVFTSSQTADATTADEEKARRRAQKAEMRAKQMAATIRGQLDYIVSSKMTSYDPLAICVGSPPAGPSPARSGSAGSPVKKSPSSRSQPVGDAVSAPRLQSPVRAKDTAVSKAGRKRPAPVHSGIPVARPPKSATASTGIPRPAMRRPLVAPPSVQRPTQKVAVSMLEPLSSLLNARPEATPVVSLKRPFSAIQPMSDRSAVAVGSATRSTLGLPVRPVREPMREIVGSQSFSLSPSHFGSVAPSPARVSVLGKPVRPTGMTPMGQRTSIASTPLRAPASSPLKQPAFRPTPSGSTSAAHSKVIPLRHPVPRPYSAAPTLLMPRLSEVQSEAPVDDDDATKGDDPTPSSEPPADQKMDVEETPAEREPSSGPKEASEGAPIADRARAAEEPQEDRRSPPSPTPEPRARRSGRATRPPPPARTPTAKKAATTNPSIVPGMSDRELRTATTRNTMRNQVYLCSIDRQIVRIPGPRPPSPTSKIPKTSDREEEIKKAEREARAKRRSRDSQASEPDDIPVVEEIPVTIAPGDEGEYTTQSRPAKRAKLTNDKDEEEERYVRWNRALTVIHGGLGEASASASSLPGSLSNSKELARDEALRSCLKSSVTLDAQGNALDRPVEKLKRSKVTVRAVFYDGEDPVEFSYASSNTRSKKKSKE